MTDSQVGLGSFLMGIAAALREAFEGYIGAEAPDLRFQRHATFAVATIEGCGARDALDLPDLRLLRDAAADAAAVCRTAKPAAGITAAVALLEEVVVACDRLPAVSSATESRWRRFLFRDADVSVRRDARVWRVRAGSREAVAKLLDVALGELLPLSNYRIAELTVQILDWFAHDERARPR